ncbi:hypothetical protein CPB86DRAFT_228496 [Serendipita vermifera]|nr:hypothetical protein CPB86DRAFT_228496 [Serendipita vermifera]
MLLLSNEIIQQIFLILAPIDLFRCCMTCRSLYLCATSFGQTRDLLTLGSYGYTTTNASPWTKDSLSRFLKYKKNQLLLYFHLATEHTHGVKQWEIETGDIFDIDDGILCRVIRSKEGGHYFTRGIQIVQQYPLSESPEDRLGSSENSKDLSSSLQGEVLENGTSRYRIDDLGYNSIGVGTSRKDNLLVLAQLTDTGELVLHLYTLTQYSLDWGRVVHPLAKDPELQYTLPLEIRRKYASWSSAPQSTLFCAKVHFGKDMLAVDVRPKRPPRLNHINNWRELVVWNWRLGIRYPIISGMDDACFITPTCLLLSYSAFHPSGGHIAIVDMCRSTPEELHVTRFLLPFSPRTTDRCQKGAVLMEILLAKPSNYYDNPLVREKEDVIQKDSKIQPVFPPINIYDRSPWAPDPDAGICCVKIYYWSAFEPEGGWIVVISKKHLLRVLRASQGEGPKRTKAWEEWNNPSSMRWLPISFAEFGLSISGSTLLCVIPEEYLLRQRKAQSGDSWSEHVMPQGTVEFDFFAPGAMVLFDFEGDSPFHGDERHTVEDVGVLVEDGNWNLRDRMLQEVSNSLPFKAYVSWRDTDWMIVSHEASWFVYEKVSITPPPREPIGWATDQPQCGL